MKPEIFKQLLTTIRSKGREIAGQILESAASYTNGEVSFVCPSCGHGANGNGLCFDPKHRDGNTLICHACNFKGDITDVYCAIHNVKTNQALIELGRQGLGLNISDEGAISDDQLGELNRLANEAEESANEYQADAEARKADRLAHTGKFKNYIDSCAVALQLDDNAEPGREYLAKRGFGLELLQKFKIGFDVDKNAVVVPSSDDCFYWRYLDPKHEPQKKNANDCVMTLFNSQAITDPADDKPIFICEGALTALSFEAIGLKAIALNGAGNYPRLAEALTEKPIKNTLVLVLDNDKPGAEATTKLRQELTAIGVNYIDGRATLYGKNFIQKPTATQHPKISDANELLMSDKKAFIDATEQLTREGGIMPDNVQDYIFNGNFMADIEHGGEYYPTGFSNIDGKIEGLEKGRLYVVGAVPSMGKTTFCLQIANQVAEQGQHVIYFAMEQSPKELICKSITYTCARLNRNTDIRSKPIIKGQYEGDTPQAEEVARGMVNFAEKHKHLSIVNCGFTSNIDFIQNYIKRYQHQTGADPLVIVDYLQLLRPVESEKYHTSAKETVDEAMKQLKALALANNIPVLAVSSFNRNAYSSPASFESFKETGNIEYTADYVWALQLSVMKKAMFEDKSDTKLPKRRKALEEAKARMPRQIWLHQLKGRDGNSIDDYYFDYDAPRETFTPSDAPDEQLFDDTDEDDER